MDKSRNSAADEPLQEQGNAKEVTRVTRVKPQGGKLMNIKQLDHACMYKHHAAIHDL